MEPFRVVKRLDYLPSIYRINHIDLNFDLHPTDTIVTSTLYMSGANKTKNDLVLHGEGLQLKEIKINGKVLTSYTDKPPQGGLSLPRSVLGDSDSFQVQTSVSINPTTNRTLMGLYKSGGLYCTQCEAEGFRRITYYLDRPDIMATFKVKIVGDKDSCPIMLCNGNKIQCKETDGKNVAVFDDPHLKPCYLFALVAGKMEFIQSHFITMSGKKVNIEIFSEPRHVKQLHWALESIKMAMKWDEEAFGREYDLDNFYIVCVSDFNMGAMENKGLNIFNTALLLADPKTTTDAEYKRILNVVGHEYFHNWSGNRVTCRDWFQLTLKEGLTVFRDQEFIRALTSPTAKRVEDVSFLVNRQFAEDAGPMAHPIRPEQYLSVDNFYTATVYDKGAEVIRMYDTLLGKSGFRKGLDLYFSRHDGQAVTCDDFFNAMVDANKDAPTAPYMAQFVRWYSQKGTPVVEVKESTYADKKYTITLEQSNPPDNQELLIPIKIGFIGQKSGKDIIPEQVICLTKKTQTFTFELPEEPIPSLFRDFSAPVILKNPFLLDNHLCHLMVHDTDPVNRWSASHQLFKRFVLARVEKMRGCKNLEEAKKKVESLPEYLIDSVKSILKGCNGTRIEQSYALGIPEEEELHLGMTKPVDYEAVFLACKSVKEEIYEKLKKDILDMYSTLSKTLEDAETNLTVNDSHCMRDDIVGTRRLRNVLLSYICATDAELYAPNHFEKSSCMSDRLVGFRHSVNLPPHISQPIIDAFYEFANGDELVIDKWFSLQASSESEDCLDRVKKLVGHKDFCWENPNRLRSLLFAFCRNSPKFHREDAEGYKLLADAVIKTDSFNPQIAARACCYLTSWRQDNPSRQSLIKNELKRISETPNLSRDTMEIVQKAL